MYTPENLKRWVYPDSYVGPTYEDYYLFLSRNRDSRALQESNFFSACNALGLELNESGKWCLDIVDEQKEDEDGDPLVLCGTVRDSHWAVGWIEYIIIHESAENYLKIADRLAGELEDYPVIDEEDLSEREMEAANEVWKNCYDWRERVDYIRKHRSQFEPHDFADLLGCVRGEYFIGYASELIDG